MSDTESHEVAGDIPKDPIPIGPPPGSPGGPAAHQFAKTAWRQTNLRMETFNAAQNFHILHRKRDDGQVKCLSQAPKGDRPALVIGSGSTCNAVMPDLKDWKGAIVCSTSHGSTVVKYGASPDYMLAVDPRTAVGDQDEMGVPPGGWDHSAYVAHVSGPFEYFRRWFDRTKAPCYLIRLMEPNYMWYKFHLPVIYPWVKIALLPFIDSLASEVQLAGRLGFDPVYLIGADYGGPRFDCWQYHQKAGMDQPEWIFFDGMNDISKEFMGPGGIPTGQQLMYSMLGTQMASFMQITHRRQKTRIYQCSRPSNLTCLPFVPWSEVLEKQGQAEPWADDYRHQIQEDIEVSLAGMDSYMIPSPGGCGIDYRVYIMHPNQMIVGLAKLNHELLNNKYDMAEKEIQYGMKISDMIDKGMASIEEGDMLLYGEDMKNFDWRRMSGIDVEAIYQRCLMLKKKNEELKATMPKPTGG